MKLPNGISDYETPFNVAFAEAIVRDCAKVLRDLATKHPDASSKALYNFAAVAILARYGLESE